jgi:hypothetical protein
MQYDEEGRFPMGFAFAVVTLLVGVNLIYLDILAFHQSTKPKESPNVTVIPLSPTLPPNDICPQSCLTKIQERILPISPTSSQLAPTSTIGPSNREFFIPFGSGSSIASDWENVAGLESSINTANYPRITKVTFEATLRTPTGNQTAFARLYNVTDKHPVWFSDVSVDGGITKLVISTPVSLDAGNKTYQVQMKTSLGFQSFLDQSRLRISTQ